jgi:hypothetical protein
MIDRRAHQPHHLVDHWDMAVGRIEEGEQIHQINQADDALLVGRKGVAATRIASNDTLREGWRRNAIMRQPPERYFFLA